MAYTFGSPFTFADATARAAYVITTVDYQHRRTWQQQDTGMTYRPVRSGAGLENWEEVYNSGDMTFSLPVSLMTFRRVADADNNISGTDFGILHATSTPALLGDSDGGYQKIKWNAGSVVPIAAHITCPKELYSLSNNIYLELSVSSGSSDPANFTVETSPDDAGKIGKIIDDSLTLSALHHVVYTGALVDIPSFCQSLVFRIIPPTHATDPVTLRGLRLVGVRVGAMPAAGAGTIG